MNTDLIIFISVMAAAAAAELILSLVQSRKKIVIIPLADNFTVSEEFKKMVGDISLKTAVYLTDMGLSEASRENVQFLAENAENIFFVSDGEILTYL